MGGQRIDDHSFWAGKAGKGMVLPDGGGKVKEIMDDGHAGHLDRYEDNQEAIKAQQELNMKKAKSLPMKPNYRY